MRISRNEHNFVSYAVACGIMLFFIVAAYLLAMERPVPRELWEIIGVMSSGLTGLQINKKP